MKIRKFQDSDINQIVTLFYETVHTINARDYSADQLQAWAPKGEKIAKIANWKVSLSHNITYVAEINGEIVGFADMTPEGHLDRLYIHKDYQGQGIAVALMNTIEADARKLGLTEMDTEASITAKPFFERQGYQTIQLQVVERNGVNLVNFKMTKLLSN
ncbi:GNAT family N-acetyltransferase [Paenibacillus sp. WQ 127069]|uniref:GNAT family N-acetyltransferase n=1 Tax=Paenibacillus baimaensis TaxID=2982185 RepID=A0ABT2UJM3_9BACL|nr:GNAT family N-acetyltransferase [Paenibacillus sp. WQ 127069]MCU6793854.1 GNAT family N-acetyltransferase [Paenibacillus sp. WQ 127069]